YLAIVAFALVELLVVGVASFRLFAGPYEFVLALKTMAPILLVVAFPCSVVTGLVLTAARGADRALYPALFAFAVGSAAGVAGVSSGGTTWLGGAAVFVGSAAATFALGPVVARALAPRAAAAAWLGGAAFALAVGFEVVHRTIASGVRGLDAPLFAL